VGRMPAGNTWARGVHTVNHAAVDGSGNSATCGTTVTVVDTTGHTVTCPVDIVLESNHSCNASSDPQAAAADHCGVASIARDPGGTVWTLGAHTVTHTATDTNGNTSSCTSLVTVVAEQLACFSVHKGHLHLDKHADDDKDPNGHLHIDGRYRGHPCNSVDLTTEGARLTVDGETFVVPAGAFQADGKSEKFKYKYEAKNLGDKKDKLKWELKVDTKKGSWKFKSEHHNTSGFTPTDGLAVHLTLGDEHGAQVIPVFGADKKLDLWKFHAGHETLCPKLDKSTDDE